MYDLIKPTVKQILMAVILIAGFACCSRDSRYNHPTGWLRLGEPIDSITRNIELAFVAAVPVDSLAALVDSYAAIADGTNGSNEVLSRLHFWNGRIAGRRGDKAKRFREFNMALKEAPAETQDYIRRRIGWLEEKESDFSRTEWYSHQLEEVDFYSKRHDFIMLYVRYHHLMDLMRDIGYMDRAEHYFRLQDSCLQQTSGPGAEAANSLNRAALLYDIGRIGESGEIYRKLCMDSTAMSDAENYQLVHYNMYVVYGDTSELNKAYRKILEHGDRLSLLPKIHANLAAEALEAGNVDEASIFADKTESELDRIGKSDKLLMAMSTLARVREAQRDSGRALKAYKRFALCADSVAWLMMKNDVATLEAFRSIQETDRIIALQKKKHNLRILLYVAGAAFIVVLMLLFAYRKYRNLKRAKMRADEKIRVTEQHQLAIQIETDHKNQLIERAVTRIRQLSESDVLNRQRQLELERILTMPGNTEARNASFINLFSAQNPEFINRLRKICPGLSESAVRLAAYIAIGLNTKEISELTNVQPESVKQARWRLKKSLSLPAGADLYAFLTEMLSQTR